VLEFCGGEPSDVVVAGQVPADPAPIAFRVSEVKRLTGFDLPEDDIAKILTDLGFGIRRGDVWTVSVPSHRRDCTMSADLVEEVARIHGLHKMEATPLPPVGGRKAPLATPLQNRIRLGRRALAMRGLSEAVTWSFVAQAHAELFDGGGADLQLDNPISPELATMRPSALIHLLLSGQKAADKGTPGAALFEAGPTYQNATPEGQKPAIAGMRRCEMQRHWQGNTTPDAFTAKADALAALAAMGAKVDNLQTVKPTGSYWHPGRSGRLQMGPKNVLADFGELHPGVLKSMGVEGRVVAFEIWPAVIPPARKKSKTKGALKTSDLMPVHRDFAFIVPADLPAEKLIRAVRGADKTLITEVNLFDVYAGKGIPEGHKSLALDVTLQPKDQTLTDKEIEAISAKIIAQAAKTGAELRG
ncbi:MAG TPA: phenylalanine--tRNA ligase subunit beta, partial [Hellea balneolensis]|nr:phenylalanine--tRNA ligase subunit beta [Hellea balneolensis]